LIEQAISTSSLGLAPSKPLVFRNRRALIA
jgi:hypothetical protein